jgi:inosine-uridine nucleoside N-ribohydrolase
MTNLAVALALDPTIPGSVNDSYLMGGAAMTAGNTTPMAEVNFHNDPAAASRVIQNADPTMVGLDVTNRATVAPNYAENLDAESPAAQAVADWLDYSEEGLELGGGRRPLAGRRIDIRGVPRDNRHDWRPVSWRGRL